MSKDTKVVQEFKEYEKNFDIIHDTGDLIVKHYLENTKDILRINHKINRGEVIEVIRDSKGDLSLNYYVGCELTDQESLVIQERFLYDIGLIDSWLDDDIDLSNFKEQVYAWFEKL